MSKWHNFINIRYFTSSINKFQKENKKLNWRVFISGTIANGSKFGGGNNICSQSANTKPEVALQIVIHIVYQSGDAGKWEYYYVVFINSANPTQLNLKVTEFYIVKESNMKNVKRSLKLRLWSSRFLGPNGRNNFVLWGWFFLILDFIIFF